MISTLSVEIFAQDSLKQDSSEQVTSEKSSKYSDKEKSAILKRLLKDTKKSEFVEDSKRATWFAYALRVNPQDRIDKLELKFVKLPVFLVPTEKSFRPLIQLRLLYDNPEWTLFDGEDYSLNKVNTENEYAVYAFLNSRLSTVKIYAVGPNESLEEELIYIFSPEAKEFKTTNVFNSTIFSIGYANVTYEQSTFGTFVVDAIYLGLKYESPENGKRLGYYADASSSLYTVASDPVNEPSNYLEAHGGLSYNVKLFKDFRYRSRIKLGISTVNFFTYGRNFGFTGLFGPSLGLKSEYFKDGSKSYTAEIGFSPYDFSNVLQERTVRLEAGYNLNLKNLRRARFGLEYSNTKFSFEIEDIEAHFFVLKFGLGF